MKANEIAKEESTNIVLIGIKLFIARLFLSQQKYNNFLHKQMFHVTPKAFPYYSGMLIDCIKFTKKKSSEYRDTAEETKSVMDWFPILKPYYREVHVVTEIHRKKWGLKV